MKFLRNIAAYLSFVVSLFSIIVSALLFTYTTDFKLEKLSYDICNYNATTYDNFNSSMISISFNNLQNNYKNYFILQNKFLGNDFVDGFRYVSNEPYDIINTDTGLTHQVHFIAQNVFSKQKKSENTFVLDYKQYAVYNTFDLEYSRGTDFCFISEELANKILTQKGCAVTEENRIELYNSLCATNENRGTLFTYEDVSGKKISLSVLGVLKSTYGKAYSQAKKSLLPFKYRDLFNFNYEINLKINPYGNKNTLAFCMNNYKDETNYKMQIKQFNGSGYTKNDILTEEYYSIMSTLSSSATCYYYALFVIVLGFVIFFLFNIISFKSTNKSIFIVLVCYLLLFIAYGVIANFKFIYPLSTLVLLVYLINYVFIGRKQLYEFFSKIMEKIKTKFAR